MLTTHKTFIDNFSSKAMNVAACLCSGLSIRVRMYDCRKRLFLINSEKVWSFGISVHHRDKASSSVELSLFRPKVPDAYLGHLIYSILQGIQLKLLLGRTQSDRACSLHRCIYARA